MIVFDLVEIFQMTQKKPRKSGLFKAIVVAELS